MASFTPAAIRTISDPAATRAFLHPLRFRILRMLVDEALTISAVARRLAVHPANLTHHFRLLEQGELIRPLGERPAGRGSGRLYRAAALRFSLAPSADEHRDATVLRLLGAELHAAAEALPAAGPPVLARLATVRLSPRRAALFRRRLVRLVEDFLAMEKSTGEEVTLCLAYYRQQHAAPRDPAPSGAPKG